MPLYNFHCATCGPVKRILKPAEVRGQLCPSCGVVLERTPEPPSSQVMERLDNGIMPRAVTRLRDAEQLSKDRSKKAKEE